MHFRKKKSRATLVALFVGIIIFGLMLAVVYTTHNISVADIKINTANSAINKQQLDNDQLQSEKARLTSKSYLLGKAKEYGMTETTKININA